MTILNDQSPQANAFLDKHIHARANGLIQDLLESNQRNFDLIEKEWYQDLFGQFQDNESFHSTLELDYCPQDYEPELREPYEFWIVSDFFAQKLKTQNALLTQHWGFWIWGRETTGQSILIDYIFQKIWDDFKNKNS